MTDKVFITVSYIGPEHYVIGAGFSLVDRIQALSMADKNLKVRHKTMVMDLANDNLYKCMTEWLRLIGIPASEHASINRQLSDQLKSLLDKKGTGPY